MEFQRVAFERNPSNTVYDECYSKAKCRAPLIQIQKIGNPKLSETFPEMVDFLNKFVMDATDVNNILEYEAQLEKQLLEQKQQSLNNTNDTSSISLTNDEITIIWANASCRWLKENFESIDSLWKVDIIRKDCGGCGFSNYTNSSGEVVQLTNENDFIGGTCDFDTGLCQCDTPGIFGTHCDESCPGLSGPFITLNSNVSSALDTYEFEYCSGHGKCDSDNKQCECEEGYSSKNKDSNDCGYEYPNFTYSTGLQGIFWVIFGIIIIGNISSLIWLKTNLHYAVKWFLFFYFIFLELLFFFFFCFFFFEYSSPVFCFFVFLLMSVVDRSSTCTLYDNSVYNWDNINCCRIYCRIGTASR